MAKAGHGYPQVVARAGDLLDERAVTVPARGSIDRALAAARSARATVVTDGARMAARVADLERAREWALGRRPWSDVAWMAVPSLPLSADEISARRLFRSGASMVLVRDRRRVVGAIQRWAESGASLAAKLERLQGPAAEARLWLLRAAGKLGEANGHAVYATGGVIRDLVLGRDADQMVDLDFVVEEDGIAFARRLGDELGGNLVLHTAFGTASIEGGATPDGTRLPRVDIATSRRERYRRPGALPEVAPAGIDEDLGRRDFSVNAMAVALAPSAWGRLHDSHGGRDDVLARRLRVLHPLSLVEDPTRIWRGARYAARLSLRPDAGFRRALALAYTLAPYPALSGQRLLAELELVMAEGEPWRALGLLFEWGAFRLWDPSYRVTAATRRRFAEARALLSWARESGITVDATELALLSVLFDQSRPVAERCLRRLAVTSGLAAMVDPTAARDLARRLAAMRPRRASRVAELLRPAREMMVLGTWLASERPGRREIEWYLREGHAVRALSSGADVVAAGVPRGPLVGQALGLLRDLRLDGRVRTLSDERAAVADWMRALSMKGDLR